MWQKTTEVAVKTLHDVNTEDMENFYNEIETLSQLRHPSIVVMVSFEISRKIPGKFVEKYSMATVEKMTRFVWWQNLWRVEISLKLYKIPRWASTTKKILRKFWEIYGFWSDL